MRCLVAGTARDIEKVWPHCQQSLNRIAAALDDYHCVLVESNSSDKTLTCLRQWESQDTQRRHVLSLGTLSEPSRTRRIAQGRNEYMNFFQTHQLWDQFDYLLVVDIDSLQIESNFKQQLESCLHAPVEHWDGIGSNRRGPYYDTWALRSKAMGIDYDCWERYGQTKDLQCIAKFQKTIPPHAPWIPCESAFCCMALYKTAAVKQRRYNGNTTCEHVSFHKGLRMFINPQFISGYACAEDLIPKLPPPPPVITIPKRRYATLKNMRNPGRLNVTAIRRQRLVTGKQHNSTKQRSTLMMRKGIRSGKIRFHRPIRKRMPLRKSR